MIDYTCTYRIARHLAGAGVPFYTVAWHCQALTSAVDLFSAQTPHLTGVPEAEREFLDLVKDQIEKLSQMVRDRKVRAALQKTGISASFKDLAAEGPGSVAAGLAQLSAIISDFDKMIAQQRNDIAEQEAAFDREMARLAPRAVETVRRTRKQINRFFKLAGEFHNETVEFYYFLLALRAEYDPDAKGGPSFKDRRSLVAYLREQMKV